MTRPGAQLPDPLSRSILAVDLGTSGVKVALITIEGRVAGWESEPVALRVLPGGGAEQRPDDWWDGLVAAAGRLLRSRPAAARDIAAVCCSTQGEGTVPVDRRGPAAHERHPVDGHARRAGARAASSTAPSTTRASACRASGAGSA